MTTRTITLGGAERTFRYDLNAIAAIGERLDVNIRLRHVGTDLLEKPLPLKGVRTILWAGLIWDNPDLSEEEVGGWVDQDNLVEVMQFFFGFFSSTSPDLQEQVASKLNLEVPASEEGSDSQATKSES